MYGHVFATLFLAEVYGMAHRADLRETLRKAIRLIVNTQNDEGGWRYQPVRADVVDFKTDVISTEDPHALAAQVEVYRPQLDAYRRAVATLLRLDERRISARLVFVEPGIVEAV